MLPLAFALVFTGQSAALAGHGKKANSGDPDNANHYVDRNDMSLSGSDAVVHGTSQLERRDTRSAQSGPPAPHRDMERELSLHRRRAARPSCRCCGG